MRDKGYAHANSERDYAYVGAITHTRATEVGTDHKYAHLVKFERKHCSWAIYLRKPHVVLSR